IRRYRLDANEAAKPHRFTVVPESVRGRSTFAFLIEPCVGSTNLRQQRGWFVVPGCWSYPIVGQFVGESDRRKCQPHWSLHRWIGQSLVRQRTDSSRGELDAN